MTYLRTYFGQTISKVITPEMRREVCRLSSRRDLISQHLISTTNDSQTCLRENLSAVRRA